MIRSLAIRSLATRSLAIRDLAIAMVLAIPNFGWSADFAEMVALFRAGKYEQCAAETAKAIADDNFREGFRLLKIQTELELGRYEDAATTLAEALKRFPNSIELRWIGRTVHRFQNQTDLAEKLEREVLELASRTRWMYSDAGSQLVLAQYFLGQKIDPKEVINSFYDPLKKRFPNFLDVHLASGQLALSKGDFALAAESYQQAIKIDANSAEAHFGLASAFAPSDSEKANVALLTALEKNPNHIPGLLMVVDGNVDSEHFDEADKVLQHIGTVNPHHPLASAYRAVLAHLRGDSKNEELHRRLGLRFWSSNPEVDHLIGRKLSRNYRFREGAAYQRRSLELDSNYLPAKLQLSHDLLRLGHEEEAWRLAEAVSHEDGYNILAHNLSELRQAMSKFRTLEEEGLILRMEAREADIYGRRVMELLKRAKRELCEKYEVKLERPIVVEMFPRQQDFAIRTFGLPGGAGFLGVCFGDVITANSPASQADHPVCWEATLWHEFCHVVTLNKTHNKMPRWLSEGISVYEERVANKFWGQAITPEYREMMLGDELTPVASLSAAFLNPPSPKHLQFAYYESSLVVEFFVQKYGIDTLRRMLVDLGVGMPINDALARYTGSLDSFNAEFVAHAKKTANSMAPDADWSKPELPRRATTEAIANWVKEHPKNYAALQRLADQLMLEKRWAEAKIPLDAMRKLYPGDFRPTGPHAAIARVHRELGEFAYERAALEELTQLSADNLLALTRLVNLAIRDNDPKLGLSAVQRMLGISPLQAETHRAALSVAEMAKNDSLAIESLQAMLMLDPIDRADLEFRLAGRFKNSGDLAAAKRHALMALEETPRFRAAQVLLLEVVELLQKTNKDVSTNTEQKQ